MGRAMPLSIQCPDCHVTLKANKTPPPGRLMECLHCGYRFTLSEAMRSHVPPPAPPPTASYGSTMMVRVLVGGILAIALVVAGLVWTYQSTRPETPPPVPSAPSQEKKPEPKPVVKAETKMEPMAEPKAEPKVVDLKEPEPKVDLKLDSNRQLFTHLMIDGGIAMQLKRFDEAVDAYSRAQKLFPDNADARAKLVEAQAGLEVAAKAKRELDQVQADAAIFLKRGHAALDKENFAAALEFYKLALQKSPTNEEAAEGLLNAQARIQKADAEKKKLEDFDRHVLSGKAAMRAGKPADAVREFMAAGRILPNDPLPAELLKEAEKQLAPVKMADGGDDKKKAFQNLLDRANGALKQRNLEDAEDAFRQALKLYPLDPLARRGLEDVEKLIKGGRAEVANLLAQAQQHIANQQVGPAMNLLRDAERLMPTNPDLLRALKAAELIQLNQVAYYNAINQANNAMALHLYGDAILAYTSALQIVPGDPLASVGLLEAERRLAIQNRRKLDYDAFVAQGLVALRNQRYLEARNSFQAAMQRAPLVVDPQVQLLFRYSDDMAQGFAALNARNFVAAGRFFQAALVEIPNDPAAFLGLQRAQFGNKGRPIP